MYDGINVGVQIIKNIDRKSKYYRLNIIPGLGYWN